MLELAQFEGRRRVRGSLALGIGLALLGAMMIWVFPSIDQAGVDLEEYVDAWPPALRQMFSIEAIGTIEGFMAAELYAFGWVILLGLYMAYSAASLIADDVEHGRMDMTLSLPVSRWRVVVEKYLTMLVPIVVVNAIGFLTVYIGLILIDESISTVDLLAVHLLSVPYLLATASIGVLASVLFDRATIAQRVAAGAAFGLFLIESVLEGTDYGDVGLIAPSRYYDPTEILVHSEYNLEGAALLLVASAVIVAASAIWFSKKDVS